MGGTHFLLKEDYYLLGGSQSVQGVCGLKGGKVHEYSVMMSSDTHDVISNCDPIKGINHPGTLSLSN